MIKLLIIADDFTGALDTGVQFAASGASTRVVTNSEYALSDERVDVLVVDAETRHLSPQRAFEVTAGIVNRACGANIPHLYKKTDSALRGNIGAELSAMLEASGLPRIHFVPAFPHHGRTTVGGIHYINGQPVAEGIFGKDPFEPVRYSRISDIIADQTNVAVTHFARPEQNGNFSDGILLYDAETDAQIETIAQSLVLQGETKLLAGCAGFAAALPGILGMTGMLASLPEFDEGFLVACGSVNPITRAQLDRAEQSGFLRIRLSPTQRSNPRWMLEESGDETLRRWKYQCRAHKNCILDVNDLQGGQVGDFNDQLRQTVSETMGGIVKELLDDGLHKNLMVTGGDTLLGFLRCIGTDTLDPVCELAPGVVLTHLQYGGKTYNLISKSGGFGVQTLLPDLACMMENDRNGVLKNDEAI